MSLNLASTYEELFNDVLVPISFLLQKHLAKVLEGVPRIDAVAARAKSPERFISKALKQDDEFNLKYSDPLSQIQDQVGARITVLYLSDIIAVKQIIDKYFHAIEWQSKQPERDAEFGYTGDHYILGIPDDAIPEGLEDRSPSFFELQIKTLYQHAWSEASHDIGYKAPRALSALEKRQMAFSAAQSWGADQIFKTLAESVTGPPSNDI